MRNEFAHAASSASVPNVPVSCATFAGFVPCNVILNVSIRILVKGLSARGKLSQVVKKVRRRTNISLQF